MRLPLGIAKDSKGVARLRLGLRFGVACQVLWVVVIEVSGVGGGAKGKPKHVVFGKYASEVSPSVMNRDVGNQAL